MELPLIISVDDHVIEPPDVWQSRLPKRFLERAPRVEKSVGQMSWNDGFVFTEGDGPGSAPMDLWRYDDLIWPIPRGMAQVEHLDELAARPITYDEMAAGCYDQAARIAAMDANHTEASLCFPSFPRFCGQTFLEREDKELALLCVQAYNDWMIDDWCAGAGAGRLIPCTLIPLWDPDLAAAEIRRCADKGSFSVAFSEDPVPLGLPSIYGDHWDPFFQACDETGTVVSMHIGSSSKLTTMTAPDAPMEIGMVLVSENSAHAFVDWLSSGRFHRHPNLKIALSEGQVGWMPFLLERLDRIWDRSHFYGGALRAAMPEPPSTYMAGRIYGCMFDDLHGLASRDVVGMSQIMFETDYPHADTTFPDSREIAAKLIAQAGLNEKEAWQLLRGNAIECYGLQRFGIKD